MVRIGIQSLTEVESIGPRETSTYWYSSWEFAVIDNNNIVDTIINEDITSEDKVFDLILGKTDHEVISYEMHGRNFNSKPTLEESYKAVAEENNFEPMFTMVFSKNQNNYESYLWWVLEQGNFRPLESEMLENETNSDFTHNFSEYIKNVPLEPGAYRALHALQRNTDGIVSSNHLLNTWAYNDTKKLLNDLPRLVRFCKENKCRLYANVNNRSSFKTLITMQGMLNDLLMNNGTNIDPYLLRDVFKSSVQRPITRSTETVDKNFMLDVDSKDEENLRLLKEKIQETGTVLKSVINTPHGFHIIVSNISKNLYTILSTNNSYSSTILKDSKVFLGYFE